MHKCMCSVLLEKSIISFKNKKYNHYKCSVCGLVTTSPLISVKEDIYESGHYKVKSLFIIPLIINFFDYIYILILAKQKSIKKSSYILDFGSGKGLFLYFLKLFKFKNLYGLETSKSRADFSSNLTGLKISNQFYNSGKIHGVKYDYISLIHVLEHIESPFKLIDNLLNTSLNKNGVLFIEVPNINSLGYKIGKHVWAHFTPHFHTNHFTSLCLQKYCDNNNLKFKLLGTFSFYNSSMGMASSILSLFGYKGIIFEDLKNKNIFIVLLFLLLIPFTITIELASSFFNKGSVIKCFISKE